VRLHSSKQLDYPVKTLSSSLGLNGQFKQPKYKRTDIDYVVTDSRPFVPFDGYHFIIHDPLEVPSDSSTHFYTMPNRTTEYLINPKIMTFERSLKIFELDE
jgi:hypothetical protein